MKPINFKEANIIFAKNQPQYKPLPAWRTNSDCDDGQVISCWSMNFVERLKVLFTGKIYLSLLTFHKPIQPQKLRLTFKEAKND